MRKCYDGYRAGIGKHAAGPISILDCYGALERHERLVTGADRDDPRRLARNTAPARPDFWFPPRMT
jgi:hypothetical protein